MHTLSALQKLSRAELQKLAKANGIKANIKSVDIIAQYLQKFPASSAEEVESSKIRAASVESSASAVPRGRPVPESENDGDKGAAEEPGIGQPSSNRRAPSVEPSAPEVAKISPIPEGSEEEEEEEEESTEEQNVPQHLDSRPVEIQRHISSSPGSDSNDEELPQHHRASSTPTPSPLATVTNEPRIPGPQEAVDDVLKLLKSEIAWANQAAATIQKLESVARAAKKRTVRLREGVRAETARMDRMRVFADHWRETNGGWKDEHVWGGDSDSEDAPTVILDLPSPRDETDLGDEVVDEEHAPVNEAARPQLSENAKGKRRERDVEEDAEVVAASRKRMRGDIEDVPLRPETPWSV